MREKITQKLAELPALPEQLRQAQASLENADMTNAMGLIKAQKELWAFIAWVNLIHQRVFSTPIFARHSLLDRQNANLLSAILELFASLNLSQTTGLGLFKLSQDEFKLFGFFLLFNWQKISQLSPPNEPVPPRVIASLSLLLPLVQTALQACFLDAKSVALAKDASFDELLKDYAQISAFEILQEYLIQTNASKTAKEIAHHTQTSPSNGLIKTLLGYEINRPKYAHSRLWQLFSFDEEMPYSLRQKASELLGA